MSSDLVGYGLADLIKTVYIQFIKQYELMLYC